MDLLKAICAAPVQSRQVNQSRFPIAWQARLPPGARLAGPGAVDPGHLAWTLLLFQALGLCHQAASLAVLCLFSGGLCGFARGLGLALASPWQLFRRVAGLLARRLPIGR